MSEKRAVYAGSFDPPTKGHEWVIWEGARQYDKLFVVLASNKEKRSLFSEKERLDMLTSLCSGFPNVEVIILGNRYLAHLAEEIGALWTLRGIRDTIDYEYEVKMRDENNRINPNLETILVFQPQILRNVSSSFVKSLVGPDGWEIVVRAHLPQIIYPKFVDKFKTNEKIEKLKKRWINLCRRAKAIGDIEGVFDKIIGRYTEAHRYYHSLDHIIECLEVFHVLHPIRHMAHNPVALEFAIFLHDVIYDVGPNVSDADNVERSARLSVEFLEELGLPDVLGQEVSTLVLITKHAVIPSKKDACLMVDIDLYSLAAPPEIFDFNTANIRKEYSWVQPDELFIQGRVDFMKRFLDKNIRSSIYTTAYLESRLEAAARENLARYIKKFDRKRPV